MFTRHTLCENFRKKHLYSFWNGECYYSHGKSYSRGVSILFRLNLNIKVNCIEKDSDGNILLVYIIYYLWTKDRFTYLLYFSR